MNISVLIFTKDEEIHLERCLRSVLRSDDVVVVDSFSTDKTMEIAEKLGARFIQHEFTQLGAQITWALENAKLKHPWALILDADEVVPPGLWEEMLERTAAASQEVAAFRLKRRFHWRGAWVPRSSQYPAWLIRLVRVGRARFYNKGHSEVQEIDGAVEALNHDLVDENLKGIGAFQARQKKYAEQEARYELQSESQPEWGKLLGSDPVERRSQAKTLIRHLPARGFWFWIYLYILRGGFLEGARGWELCMEKAKYQSEIARQKKRLERENPAD